MSVTIKGTDKVLAHIFFASPYLVFRGMARARKPLPADLESTLDVSRGMENVIMHIFFASPYLVFHGMPLSMREHDTMPADL